MKKTLAAFLAVLLLVSVLPVFAEDTAPPGRVELVVSEEDADGYFTLTLQVFDLKMIGLQCFLNFDPSVFKPASFKTGELSDQPSDFMISDTMSETIDGEPITELFMFLFTSVDYGMDMLKLTCISNINQPVPNRYISSGYTINVPPNGVEICRFRFKRIGSGDIDFQLASSQFGKYDPRFPEGFDINDGMNKTPYTLSYSNHNGTMIWKESTDNTPVVPSPSPTPSTRPGGSSGTSGSGSRPTAAPDPNKALRDQRKHDTLILQIGNYAAVDDGYLCWIDDNNKQVIPYLENDRTMVPLRFISESLGANVEWDEDSQSITIRKEDTTIEMSIHQQSYLINGQPRILDASPVILEDRTFVPLRFVSEALQKSVCWLEDSQVIVIAPEEKPWDPENTIEINLLNDSLLIMSPLLRDMK